MILDSLQHYYNLRYDTSTTRTRTILRQEGNHVDTIIVSPRDDDGGSSEQQASHEEIVHCHFSAIIPFTGFVGEYIPNEPSYEDAAAIAFAVHHLNDGDGSIVPEIDGLDNKCKVKFSVEFADTQLQAGMALEHTLDQTSNRNSRKVSSASENDKIESKITPCAFIGAYRSAVSIPMGIVTGVLGYPQISATSTSSTLDDKTQYPYFARSITPDSGNAIPIIKYLNKVLMIDHLAVLNINDAYGNAFADGLRLAAEVHAPDMMIKQTPLDVSDRGNGSIKAAITNLKSTDYRAIFLLVFTRELHDDIMTEAYEQGVAGNGLYNFYCGDSFSGTLDDRIFIKDSILHKAYKGLGLLEIKGGIEGSPVYDDYISKLSQLNNKNDMDYLHHLFPKYDHLDEVDYNDPAYSLPMNDSSFLSSPLKSAYNAFYYEATIALGISACEASAAAACANNHSFTNGDSSVSEFSFTGEDHYSHLVNTKFTGLGGNEVFFDQSTGSRDPKSAVYTVTNFVEVDLGDGNVTFEPVITSIFQEGEWKSIHPYIFNDGTSNIPDDIPPLPGIVDNRISLQVRIIALALCVIVVLMSTGFMIWTMKHKKSKVVLASQSFFLYLICIGVIILSTSIIPLTIDDNVASYDGCTLACNLVPWLVSLGFSITIGALLTKTHRINMILKKSNQLKRIKVGVRDVMIPMSCLLFINFIILIMASLLSPSTFEMGALTVDKFNRPSETYGACSFGDQLIYLYLLTAINFALLFFAIYQAYQARHLSTEFSESQYILSSMVFIILILFVGTPVLFMAQDNQDAYVFLMTAIIFVTCCSLLLFMFVPKISAYNKPRRPLDERNSSSWNGSVRRISNSLIAIDAISEQLGCKVITTKTAIELANEVSILKQLLHASLKANNLSNISDIDNIKDDVIFPKRHKRPSIVRSC